MCLLFQKSVMSPHPHMWKLMVNNNMKWKVFFTQGFQINNYNTLFIGMDMMWTNTLGSQENIY